MLCIHLYYFLYQFNHIQFKLHVCMYLVKLLTLEEINDFGFTSFLFHQGASMGKEK